MNYIDTASLFESFDCINIANKFREIKPNYKEVEKIQLLSNFPLLILSVLYIQNFVFQNNIEQVIFSARDCYQLIKLYNLFNLHTDEEIETKYWFTSRIARDSASKNYLEYTKQIIGNKKTVIIDLDGTGYSISSCLNDIKQLDSNFVLPKIILLHYLPKFLGEIIHGERSKEIELLEIHGLYSGPFIDRQHARWEILNIADHSSTIDVSDDHKPIFSNITNEYTIEMSRCFSKILNDISNHFLGDYSIIKEFCQLNDRQIETLFNTLYGNLYMFEELSPTIYTKLLQDQSTDEKEFITRHRNYEIS